MTMAITMEYKMAKNNGEKQRTLEIAKEMLKQNCNIDLIISVTGLAKEEIEKLK